MLRLVATVKHLLSGRTQFIQPPEIDLVDARCAPLRIHIFLHLAWRHESADPVIADSDERSNGILQILLIDGENELGLRVLDRSEEHTSELQSRENLVCRLLLEKKKQQQ